MKKAVYPDKVDEAKTLVEFLQLFPAPNGQPKYMQDLQRIANGELSVLQISLDDLAEHMNFTHKIGDHEPMTLVRHIERNAKAYFSLFYMAVDALMPDPTVDVDLPVLHRQRLERYQQMQQQADANVTDELPASLMRR